MLLKELPDHEVTKAPSSPPLHPYIALGINSSRIALLNNSVPCYAEGHGFIILRSHNV